MLAKIVDYALSWGHPFTMLRALLYYALLLCAAAFPSIGRSDEPLRIGASLALSGKLAFIGEEERRGLSLAADELNDGAAPDQPKVLLQVEDNKGEPRSAVTSVQKFLSGDPPDVIFSAFTHVTEAIAPLVDKSDALLVYAATSRAIASRNPRFFRDYVDAADCARAAADRIVRDQHRQIVYVGEIGDACEEYFSSLRSSLEEHDITISLREDFLPAETDLKPQLLKVRARKPSAMAFCAWRHTQLLARQLDELGMSGIPSYHWLAPFLPAADTSGTRLLLEKSKAVTSWYGWIAPTEAALSADFSARYRRTFGGEPRPDAAYAYDMVKILARAKQSCSEMPRALKLRCMAQALADTTYDGAGGLLKFNQQRASKRPVLLMKVVGGAWRGLDDPIS